MRNSRAKSILHVLLFPMENASATITWRKVLREWFWPPGYNCNYMNHSRANYIRNNFVDHGTLHLHYSGQVRPRQGTKICNFGVPSPLEALHWIFGFFSSIYVQFGKTSPLKSGESSEKSSGENRVKSCHVCGCHGFFSPELQQFFKLISNTQE